MLNRRYAAPLRTSGDCIYFLSLATLERRLFGRFERVNRFTMTGMYKTNGFTVTKWYLSKTLNQQFPDGTSFNTAHAIHCEPKPRKSKDPSKKLAELTLEWGYILKNYIEYIADDVYYVDYTDFTKADEFLIEVIKESKNRFLKHFERRNTGVDVSLLPDFDSRRIDELRQKILIHLQK